MGQLPAVLSKSVRLITGVFNLTAVSVSLDGRGMYTRSWGGGLGNANDDEQS